MMGDAHALSGVAVGMAAVNAHLAPPLAALMPALPTGQALLVAAVTGGAAVLPDIDHPDSTVSRTFGPITWLLAKAVNALSGGHRNGTHSALGCSVLALTVFAATGIHTGTLDAVMGGVAASGVLLATAVPVWLLAGPSRECCYKTPWGGPAAISVFVFAILAVLAAALVFGPIVGTVLLGLMTLLALSALARAMRIPGKWDDGAAAVFAYLAVAPPPWRFGLPEPDVSLLPWALTLGVVVHCAGDAITKGGVPWAWPLTQVNVGPQVILTDGATERRLLVPLFVLVVGAGVALLSGPVAGVGAVLGLWWLIAETKPKKRPARRSAGA